MPCSNQITLHAEMYAPSNYANNALLWGQCEISSLRKTIIWKNNINYNMHAVKGKNNKKNVTYKLFPYCSDFQSKCKYIAVISTSWFLLFANWLWYIWFFLVNNSLQELICELNLILSRYSHKYEIIKVFKDIFFYNWDRQDFEIHL